MEITQAEQQDFCAVREKDIEKLEAAGLTAYPHKFEPNINNYSNNNKYDYILLTINEFIEHYRHLGKGDIYSDFYRSLIGRAYFVRRASKKLIFIDLHQEGAKIQVMINAQFYLNGKDHYDLVTSIVRSGDWIGVAGVPTRTKTGELSIIPHRMEILSICKVMLPPRTYKDSTGNEVSGLQDQETRFRQRYLDLIINEDNIKIFHIRSKIIREIRRYLDEDLNLLEVETPILNLSVGGASAEPFETYSNYYKHPLFARIAPELSLKMLIVGGFKGVYELGKQFRNEASDHTHNPEFTSLEFYIQNHDFNDLMTICEQMLDNILSKVNKFKNAEDEGKTERTRQIEYGDKIIDFSTPFKRLDMIDTLEREANIKLPQDLSTDDARQFLDDTCITLGVDCSNPRTTPRLLDKLVGHFVEPLCINPTFITGHPQIMSPLAKQDRNGACRTERFELFINSTEYANAYTELNDPKVQLDNFKNQAKDKDMGDDEAMPIDADFVRALEYGLPPTGGFGMGIDRFVMLLTNNQNIREVLLFPTMKPLHKSEQKEVKVDDTD